MKYVFHDIATIIKSGEDPLNLMLPPKEREPELETLTKKISHTNTPNPDLQKPFYNDVEFIKSNACLLPCEEVEIFATASYQTEDPFRKGVLILTKFRLIFKFENPNQLKNLQLKESYFIIPLFQINKIEKKNEYTKYIDKYSIDLTLKDTRLLTFFIHNKSSSKFYNTLYEITFPKNREKYFEFSFSYLKYLYSFNNFIQGWTIYDPKKEFLRQGITGDNSAIPLRFTDINANFDLCPTYPELLVVHQNCDDNLLRKAADYRTKNRLPVVTYYYKKNKCRSIMWRSSQNKGGLGNKNSDSNLQLMKEIIGVNNYLYIYDARPFLNALANRVKGGGYEDEEHYTNAQVIFCDIENIHSARKALHNVYSIAQANTLLVNNKFWSGIESSNWFDFIHGLLKHSYEIAQRITEGYSVLVHCSDGWDRTSQLCSLSQLLLEPYYRTFEGFAVLIEKDWLSFGHQFGLRNGINLTSNANLTEDQKSPIFLQFLDCVYQLLHQFPHCFQFNEEFLLFLAKSSSTNLYGTFVFNNNKERRYYNADIQTASVWSDILAQEERFVNPFYNKDTIVQLLRPNYAMYNLVFWNDFFTEHSVTMQYDSIFKDNNRNEENQKEKEFYYNDKDEDDNKYKTLVAESEIIGECLDELNELLKEDQEMYDSLENSTKGFLKNMESLKMQKLRNEMPNNIVQIS